MKSEKPSYRLLLQLTVAFLFLGALLNLNYPAGRFFSPQLLLPSIDVWLLLIPLALAAWAGGRLLFWTGLPLWVFFLVLRLFRIADTTVPMYLNRPFNLAIDSGYLFDLYDLLKTSARQGEFLLQSVNIAAVALGVVISSWYAWRAATRALLAHRVRRSFLLVSGVLLGAGHLCQWPTTQPPVMVRFGRELLSIPRQLAQQRAVLARIETTARDRKSHTSPDKGLEGLRGADVLLFMVESYGQIVFNRPSYQPAMEATMAGFAEILEKHGFMAVSSYLTSPTYGGASWLAHSTLEFGVRVENDLEEKALLRSALPPLAAYFHRSGYRTVSVMPGTRFSYPEGAVFGYNRFYYAWDFGYQGPTFGWAPMSDQFVLDWVRRRELAERRQPLFIRYVLISSHAAFSIQPPFLADWREIGDGSIYHDRQLVYYPIHWPNLHNAGGAYLRSLDYEFTILGDYLAKFVDTDTLIIIMGDHQPNLQLTGKGEPWSVPVHVISRNPRLLEPFRKRSYTSGLIPAQPLPHAGMETFLPNFLLDFR
jgi:hypothetical protein